MLAAVFPWFKRLPHGECPTSGWKAPQPPKWLETWPGRSALGLLAFGFSAIVIVCVPISKSQRYNLYTVLAVLGYSLIHYLLFIYPRTARHVYKAAGFEISERVHGLYDQTKYDRLCEICHNNPNRQHRHAQEGYLIYNTPTITGNSRRARLLYRLFGGSNKSKYLDIRLDNYYSLRLIPRWMKTQPKPLENAP
jgi:hypothetical protein